MHLLDKLRPGHHHNHHKTPTTAGGGGGGGGAINQINEDFGGAEYYDV
jgi:hypothetical protein